MGDSPARPRRRFKGYVEVLGSRDPARVAALVGELTDRDRAVDLTPGERRLVDRGVALLREIEGDG